MRLNLARTLPRSAANGPGERFVVWVQGCPLACPGCWNPDTWSFAPRDVRDVADLVAEIATVAADIEGVTFTGGEPFAQPAAVAEVARGVHRLGLSVVVFSGHVLEELTSRAARALLDEIDVLVAGRFRQGQRTLRLAWRGSSNQTVHFLSDRYGPADMARAPAAEVHVRHDGSLVLTGFPEDELLGQP